LNFFQQHIQPVSSYHLYLIFLFHGQFLRPLIEHYSEHKLSGLGVGSINARSLLFPYLIVMRPD
jgi:hypothetical protein